MTALELESVSRQFVTPDGGSYRALDNVSLAIPAGAFVAIVGPSGCGKSTLLNIAAGLVPPSSGSVRVDGEALSGLNRRATYMFQQDALLPWKNVRENVALGLVLLVRLGARPWAAPLKAVIDAGWLAPGGWITVETSRGETVDPNGLALEATRDVGRARLTLLRRAQRSAPLA